MTKILHLKHLFQRNLKKLRKIHKFRNIGDQNIKGLMNHPIAVEMEATTIDDSLTNLNESSRLMTLQNSTTV